MAPSGDNTAAPLLVSITSGKGGVGKSNIAINLAAIMAGRGRRPLVMDCDLGLANIDVLMNLKPKKTLHQALDAGLDLNSVVIDSGFGFDVLPASSGVASMADLSGKEQGRLMVRVQALFNQYDTVLLDTGAGISPLVIRFNHCVHQNVVMLTPDPTAVTDAYAMIKILGTRLQENRIHLLANRVRDRTEGLNLCGKLARVVERFLGIRPDCLGYIVEDKAVRQAVIQQRLVVEAFTESAAAACLRDTALEIMSWTPGETMDYQRIFLQA